VASQFIVDSTCSSNSERIATVRLPIAIDLMTSKLGWPVSIPAGRPADQILTIPAPSDGGYFIARLHAALFLRVGTLLILTVEKAALESQMWHLRRVYRGAADVYQVGAW
jgi:hypothetical protein